MSSADISGKQGGDSKPWGTVAYYGPTLFWIRPSSTQLLTSLKPSSLQMPLFWKAFITLGLASSPSKSQIELAVPRALTEGGCQASVVPGQPQVSSAPKRKLRQRAPHSLSGHASGTWQLQLRGTVMLRQKALRTCKNSAAISDKVDKLIALKKHGGSVFSTKERKHVSGHLVCFEYT